MEHLALTVFTICIQAAIGIMLFVVIGRILNRESTLKNSIIAAAGLGLIGMLASLLHLGKPFGAIRALYQFNSSWLSREIWFTAIFVGLTVLTAILVASKPQKIKAITGLASAAVLIGLIDIYFMASIYSTTSVPFWQSVATYVEFYATAISAGAISFFLLSFKEVTNMQKIIALIIAVVVVLQVVTAVLNITDLSISANNAAQNSLTILSNMFMANILKWVFILTGAGLVLWTAKNEVSKPVRNVVIGSTFLLIAGQVIGRYLFYAAMVVTGVGLA